MKAKRSAAPAIAIGTKARARPRPRVIVAGGTEPIGLELARLIIEIAGVDIRRPKAQG